MNTTETLSTSPAAAPPVGKLSIRKHKSCAGRDGVAYSCDLYEDDFLIAHVTQDGHGGATLFRWIDRRSEDRIMAYACSLPPDTSCGEPVPMDLDMLVAGLCDQADQQKRLKRLCGKNIVFQVGTDPAFFAVKVPDSAAARARIVAKHPGKTVVFVNDRFAETAAAPAPTQAATPAPAVSSDERRRATQFKARMVATCQALTDHSAEIRRALVAVGHDSKSLDLVVAVVRALAGG